MEAIREEERYTYADYATWEDGKRWELIDGEPYMMSPAPNLRHQRIADNLISFFKAYLRGKKCEAFSAPVDVRLNAETYDDTVLQPDMIVVCDPKKLANGKNCVGAPDLVLEVLSPSTRKRDQTIKRAKYLEAGVREYWVVDPETRILYVYILKNQQYVSHVYDETQDVKVGVLEDCVIPLQEIFPESGGDA